MQILHEYMNIKIYGHIYFTQATFLWNIKVLRTDVKSLEVASQSRVNQATLANWLAGLNKA